MKHIKSFFGLIIVSIFLISYKIIYEDTKIHYLEMSGIVKQFLYESSTSESIVDSAKIMIFENKNNIETYYSDQSGKCFFRIPLNKNVTIKISKDNYVIKTLTINTFVPAKKKSSYSLRYDIYLFERIDELDVSILDYPIANIIFNNITNSFDYNRNYSDIVNQGLQKMYLNYYESEKLGSNGNIILPNNKNSSKIYKAKTSNIKISDTSSNITSIKTEEIENEIIFQIQLLALKKGPVLSGSSIFNNYTNVAEQYSDEFYKYTIGRFQNVEQAQLLLDKVLKQDFRDAFIVALKDNKRIKVGEAINLQTERASHLKN